MLQVSNRNYERISRINSGMESRLSTYKLKLEVQRQRFLRHMIYAQSFLRSECKRLKDEKFRNHSEKKLLRKNEIGKSLQIDEIITTDGLLHGPGVQGRYTRTKNLRKSGNQNSRQMMRTSTSNSSESFEGDDNNLQLYHPFLQSNDPQILPSWGRTVADEHGQQNKLNLSFSSFSLQPHHSNNRSLNSKNETCWSFPSAKPSNSTIQRSALGSSRPSRYHGIIKSQSAGLPSRRGISPQNLPNRSFTSSAKICENNENDDVVSTRRKRRLSRKEFHGRRHTAPLLDRIAQMKKDIVEEEAQYVLRLRKQSQKSENEEIAKRVWEYIGRRPVSSFSSYREISTASNAKKNTPRFEEISEQEDAELIRRMAFQAQHH